MNSRLFLIKSVLCVILFFSSVALVYHFRWFIPFLQSETSFIVPNGQNPSVWFVVQIFNNVIFLYIGFSLLRLLNKYQQTGFFDHLSLKIIDRIIVSCLVLASVGGIQTVVNNFSEVHFSQWTSFESVSNLLLRSFMSLLIFKEPQTVFLLLAILLWAIKQFVIKALFIKTENEAFV